MRLQCPLINSSHSWAAGGDAGGSTMVCQELLGQRHRGDPLPQLGRPGAGGQSSRTEPETGLLTRLLLSWGLTPKSNNKSLPVHSGHLGLPRRAVFLQGRKASLASLLIAQSNSLWLLGQPWWDLRPLNLCEEGKKAWHLPGKEAPLSAHCWV